MAAGLTLFLLSVNYWVSPTRPEPWLLAALLSVVYLCDTWRLTGRAMYLAGACGLTGVLALPMHTNASIIYIYLALFALWQCRRLTRRDWAIAVGTLGTSSLVGMAILLVPQPGALFDLLGGFSEARVGQPPVIREFDRWSRYERILFEPVFPMSVVFGSAIVVAIATLRPRLADVRSFVGRYAGILLVGLAVFIGLGLLPSAPWSQYAVYYFPMLTVLAALAYGYRPSSGLGALVCWVATVGAAGTLLIGLRLLDGSGTDRFTLALLAYYTILTAILGAGWLSRRAGLVACALVIALVCHSVLSAERYLGYMLEDREYRRLAEVHEVDVLYADGMDWALTGSLSVRGLSALTAASPAGIESGLVALRGKIGVDPERILNLPAIAPPSCATKELERINTRILPLPLATGPLSKIESIVWLLDCGPDAAAGAAAPARSQVQTKVPKLDLR